jgi:hypothetical protein
VNLGKQELDAMLQSWPAPGRKPGAAANEQDEERNWEERADAIVKAAIASKQKAASGDALVALDALDAAPSLTPEPGEEAGLPLITAAAGEKKMSQEEKEPGAAPAPSVAPPAVERKRTSLKEIAARASQSGARLSSPGVAPTATPAPSSVASVTSGASAAATAAASAGRPSTATPLPRPAEAGKDDSGVINLNVVRASVTAQQVAAAEKAKPASEGLFDDEKHDEKHDDKAAAGAAGKPGPVKVPVAVIAPKKSNAGPIAGVMIAVLGIAAAFMITARKPAPPPAAVAEKTVVVPAATVAPPAPATAAPAEVASVAPSASASSDADVKPAETAKVAAVAPSNGGTAAAVKDAPAASGTADARLAAKAPTPSGKPGDLQSEMAKAVGKDGAPGKPDQAAAPVPEPASGLKNQNVPEQPSQGAVAAAVGGVMGGAKACVAGADDVSRANVTFSSSGAVSTVSVTGWAAAHGKSGCVQAALKAAKVGPFSKSTYTVGMTIRP